MYFHSYAKISNFLNYFTTSYGCSWMYDVFSGEVTSHSHIKMFFWESPSVKVKSPTIFKPMPMDRPYPHYSNTTTFKNSSDWYGWLNDINFPLTKLPQIDFSKIDFWEPPTPTSIWLVIYNCYAPIDQLPVGLMKPHFKIIGHYGVL